MFATCLTCLSHDNLVDIFDTEWKVLEYLVSFKNYPELKSNTNTRLCKNCQGILQFVENFRTSAENNFHVGITSHHFMTQCSHQAEGPSLICFTCLSHDNLVDQCETEQKMLEVIVSSFKNHPELKSSSNVRLCTACRQKLLYINNFRVNAEKSIVQLMHMQAEVRTKLIIVPKHEPIEPKVGVELCDGSEEEIISRISDKVKVEPTDNNLETTASYIHGTVQIKMEEADAGDNDLKETLHDIKPEDAPQPMGSVFISPPTCLKPQQPGLKPPQPGLKPTKPVSKTPQTSFKAPQPVLKPWRFSDNIEELDDDAPLTIRPPQHDLKQPVPAIKPPQPGLRPPEPGLKLPQSGSIAVQPGLIAKDKKHICRYCNRPFTYPKALENHIVESHSGSSSDTKCEICNKTMKDNSSLKRHMIYHEKKNVYCDICDKWYKNCQFQRHLKISPNHNKKEDLDASSLECSACKKTFTCEMYLRRHMRYMHDQKNVHCSTCDKWFRPKSYKEHLKTSSNHAKGDEKRFTCDQCNMKFLRKSKMLLHITSKHLKLNLFKCARCPREYGSKSALTRHVQRAHERRPVPKNHVCDVCGKAFQDSQLLRRHMPVHTGERAYQCEKCGAKFKHDGTLNAHKRKCLEKRRLEITDQEIVGHPQI